MLPVEYSADDFLSLTLLNFNPEDLKRWWYRFKTVGQFITEKINLGLLWPQLT